jgi:hypothetical protein
LSGLRKYRSGSTCAILPAMDAMLRTVRRRRRPWPPARAPCISTPTNCGFRQSPPDRNARRFLSRARRLPDGNRGRRWT